MRKLFPFLVTAVILLLNSCETRHYKTTANNPVRKPYPTSSNTGSSNTSATQTEREYQNLIKTYKSETAEVLTDLLNDSGDNSKTSITVENNSRCNIVLTISGNNYFKKIPIGVNKIGAVMVPKNQNYNLSAMVCNSVYQKAKFVTSSYSIKLSN
jgi:hypothetical protein